MNNFFILTGAPGTGKSSLLAALQAYKVNIVEEPARAILAEQRKINGEGTYEQNPFLFKELMLSRMIHQYDLHSSQSTPVIFDRGIPDIIAYSKCFDLNVGAESEASIKYRYNPTVFFTPCWEEIYVNDDERKMTFASALKFEHDLLSIYESFGYTINILPKTSVDKRADLVLSFIK